MKYKYLIAFIALNILDIILAYILVTGKGVAYEFMPVMAGVLALGLVPAITAKVVISGGIGVAVYKTGNTNVFKMLIVALTFICAFQFGSILVL